MSKLYITPGKVRFDTLKDNVDNYEWSNLYIEFSMSFKTGIEVMYSDKHPDYGIIIKPKRQYLNNEFESMFGLEIGGKGYNPDIIVGVKNYDNINKL